MVPGGTWGDGRFVTSEVPLYLAHRSPPVGPFRRPMLRVLVLFVMGEVPRYLAHKKEPPRKTLPYAYA